MTSGASPSGKAAGFGPAIRRFESFRPNHYKELPAVNSTIQAPNTDFKASSFEEAFFHSTETYIHPTAVVGDNVKLGTGVKIGPFCTVVGNTTIGDGTRLHAHVTIGFPGQVVGLQQSLGTIFIGSNCELREFVTVHASRYAEGSTRIGNDCYLMNYAHVSHDCQLEDKVTLINNVNLGGHTHIETRAIVMASSATHQFCRIGTLAALAPFSGIRQDMPPFCMFNGQPGAFYGLNLIGLKRNGITSDSIQALKHVTKLFYQNKLPLQTILDAAVAEQAWGTDQYVQQFLTFIQNSTRGVSRRCGNDETSENL